MYKSNDNGLRIGRRTQNGHRVQCGPRVAVCILLFFLKQSPNQDSLYAEVGSIEGDYVNNVCPEWRTKSAYLAVMKLLLRKRLGCLFGYSFVLR